MTDADYENISAFSCGVGELDTFFYNEIRECVLRHYLSAYCVSLGHVPTIIGAFTLMNDALMIAGQTEKEDFIDDIRLSDTENDIIDFFNRQSSYPAINIGHLGIAVEYQRRGIGTAIIDLVANTFSEFNQAGCQFVTVDALNNCMTVEFYRKNQFNFQANRDFYSSTRRMYRILI